MFVAAATGEDPLDQGGDGYHIFNHKRLQLDPQGHIFHRNLQQSAACIGYILVQPGHIIGGIVEHLGTVIPETGNGLADHGGAILFPVGRVDGDVFVEGEICRSQEAGQFTAPGAAQHVEQKQAVCGGHIANTKQGITAGVAEDVWHAKVVAFDRHLIAAGLHGLLALPATAVGGEQRCGLEVVQQLIIGESGLAAHQRIVESELVIKMGFLAQCWHQTGLGYQIIKQGADQIAQARNVGGQAADAADIVLAGGENI